MMKKILAAFAAGLIVASAIPAFAASANDKEVAPAPGYGYCWQDSRQQADDGWYCGGPRRGHGRYGGYCWDDNSDRR